MFCYPVMKKKCFFDKCCEEDMILDPLDCDDESLFDVANLENCALLKMLFMLWWGSCRN
jgi:hypothetical protein